VAGLETMTIVPVQGGPPGREVDVRLAGGDPERLKKAAEEVRALLARYPGVSDIEDDLPFGKGETILKLTPRGRALGFTTQSVGRQVRNAFEGAIAKRFARGDEEVLVRVRLPRAEVDTAALGDLYLRSPIGAEVPVSEVVVATHKQGFATIKREDGARQVAITAEIDKAVTTNDKVLDALGRDGLAEIAARHGLSFEFAGRAEEQARTLNDMKTGAVVGLIAIYIILAWVFASFTQPLVVMSIIPLGLVGAILGHWALGFDLSILSLIALVGLSGIVVNDSIILVTTIDGRARDGEALESAIVNGTRDRLRAVILTSATTIGGLTPLMFERSLQAQFLIPMAVTIVFGLMVTTFLVLIVVPALLAIKGDVSRWLERWWPGERAAAPATETG
jgi:multidrug efflux pump subunit AcrB